MTTALKLKKGDTVQMLTGKDREARPDPRRASA